MPLLSVATVRPARRVVGRITVPGDKSISHRYALVAALAEGLSTLQNYSAGADCHSTLGCLRALGVDIREDGAAVHVLGRGFGGFRVPSGRLDAGNSGTTMRMLAGVLAGQTFTSTIVGDESLSRRPMRRVIEPLARMGARIARPADMRRSTSRALPSRHRVYPDDAERPGEERGAVRGPVCRGDDVGHRTGRNARPHGAGAFACSGSTERHRRHVSVSERPARHRPATGRAGRLFVCRLLDGGRCVAARLSGRDRRRRA